MLTQEDMMELYRQAEEELPVSNTAQKIYKLDPNAASLVDYSNKLVKKRILWMLNQAYNKGKHDASTQ